MEDATSRLTHISVYLFLTHSRLNLPQTMPLRSLRLPSAFKQKLTTMLINKRSPKECSLQSARKIPAPGSNVTGSVAGCASPQISKASRTRVPFLHIFAERVRGGLLSAGGNPIWNCSVEQYICSIGQIFASVGPNGPRHNRLV